VPVVGEPHRRRIAPPKVRRRRGRPHPPGRRPAASSRSANRDPLPGPATASAAAGRRPASRREAERQQGLSPLASPPSAGADGRSIHWSPRQRFGFSRPAGACALGRLPGRGLRRRGVRPLEASFPPTSSCGCPPRSAAWGARGRDEARRRLRRPLGRSGDGEAIRRGRARQPSAPRGASRAAGTIGMREQGLRSSSQRTSSQSLRLPWRNRDVRALAPDESGAVGATLAGTGGRGLARLRAAGLPGKAQLRVLLRGVTPSSLTRSTRYPARRQSIDVADADGFHTLSSVLIEDRVAREGWKREGSIADIAFPGPKRCPRRPARTGGAPRRPPLDRSSGTEVGRTDRRVEVRQIREMRRDGMTNVIPSGRYSVVDAWIGQNARNVK